MWYLNKRSKKTFVAIIALGWILFADVGCALAQAYPTRPVTMIVPYPAGGPSDIIARVVGERMSTSLGQRILIENVPGAHGRIATGRAVRAAPDGYTLSFGTFATHVLNGIFFPLPYDVVDDFEPISMICDSPMMVVANKSVPADNLQDFIAWLKANPATVMQGTPGVGSIPHLVGTFFQNAIGTRYKFVHYPGVGPAMLDLSAGRLEFMIDLVSNSLPQLSNGDIKAYAILSKARLSNAPDIPTIEEAGLPELVFSSWQAIWAPKGTPRSIISKLNAAVADSLSDPAVRNRLVDMGQTIPPSEQLTPEAVASRQRSDIGKWSLIIKGANIKPE